MSQENVEIIRRSVEVFGTGDLDRWLSEFVDPEVVWRTSVEDPDAAVHRGRDALSRYVDKWMESFDGLTAHAEEYLDAGDRVLVWTRWTGRGRGSGVPADWHLAIVYTLRDGRIVRGDEYFDRADALKAVGLEE